MKMLEGWRWWLRYSLFFGVLCLLMAPLAAKPLVSGTFFQLDKQSARFSQTRWNQELKLVSKAGIDTIVIQYLAYDQEYLFPLEFPFSFNDAIHSILNFADRNNIVVFLGLGFDSNWWAKLNDQVWLQNTAQKQIEFGQTIFKRYGHHPSFQGWYIPYESSDIRFSEAEIKNLNGFLQKIALGVPQRQKKHMMIAVSTFFKDAYFPEDVELNYKKIWANAGIDIALVQDGVGANAWQDMLESVVPPYFQAFKNAAQANQIQFWGVVEAFRIQEGNILGPAHIDDFCKQIRMARKHSEHLVMFDFINFLSPLKGKVESRFYQQYIGSCGQ